MGFKKGNHPATEFKPGNTFGPRLKGKDNPAYRHGMTGGPTHNSWWGMIRRIADPGVINWDDYGGRGISCCDRWHESFENFLEDMGARPEGKTLDRIDCNGNYEPGNCRWATKEEQNNNRNSSRYVSFRGETLSVTQWARRLGIKITTLHHRLSSGWPKETALTTPTRRWKHASA